MLKIVCLAGHMLFVGNYLKYREAYNDNLGGVNTYYNFMMVLMQNSS